MWHVLCVPLPFVYLLSLFPRCPDEVNVKRSPETNDSSSGFPAVHICSGDQSQANPAE